MNEDSQWVVGSAWSRMSAPPIVGQAWSKLVEWNRRSNDWLLFAALLVVGVAAALAFTRRSG